jgi:hypothetical protein
VRELWRTFPASSCAKRRRDCGFAASGLKFKGACFQQYHTDDLALPVGLPVTGVKLALEAVRSVALLPEQRSENFF